jgi:hypothetical protein
MLQHVSFTLSPGCGVSLRDGVALVMLDKLFCNLLDKLLYCSGRFKGHISVRFLSSGWADGVSLAAR